jgi:TetR/AcrR family transcriptional regulator, transcriptional repressor for nem operon
MGRSSTARDRLLEAACELIHTRSYGAVGVAEICALADVRKGSFYHFFDSKQTLTLAAIVAHWTAQRAEWVAVLQADGPLLDRLRRLFQATAETQRRARQENGAVNGCVLANLALELSTQDRVVQTRLGQIFDEQIDLIEQALQAAVAQGAIPPESATRPIARAVVAQMEGMILFAKLANDPDVLADLWGQTLLLLRPIAPPAPALPEPTDGAP